MTRSPMNYLVALVLCCLPALTGCSDPEKRKALADLETTQTALASANRELAATQATLDTTRKERDALRQELQDLRGRNETQRVKVDQLTADMQACQLQREQLKKQLAQAGETAAAESESLKAKITAMEEDLAQKNTSIQSLQEKIAELQQKPDAAVPPVETPAP